MSTIKRQKNQLENLRRVVEQKNRQIDVLLQDKQKLLDERVQYIDEIIKVNNEGTEEKRIKYHSVMHYHKGDQDHLDIPESSQTPIMRRKLKGKKFGIATCNFDVMNKSSSSAAYSTVHATNKTKSKERLTEMINGRRKNLRLANSTKKLHDNLFSDSKMSTVYMRSTSPKSFFTENSLKKNRVRSSQSKRMFCDQDNTPNRQSDISMNILTGSNMMLQKNINSALFGRNQSKHLELPNQNIFEEIIDSSDDEDLVRKRLTEFERQLHELKKEKLDVEQEMNTKSKMVVEREHNLESKIIILKQKFLAMSNTRNGPKDYMVTSHVDRNKSVKIAPKEISETIGDEQSDILRPLTENSEEEYVKYKEASIKNARQSRDGRSDNLTPIDS